MATSLRRVASMLAVVWGVDGLRQQRQQRQEGSMEASANQTRATITSSGELLVNGAPLHMKGICWSPVAKGNTYPAGLDFAGFAASDADLMKRAGINVVRGYEPITDRQVLDTFLSNGIYVVNSAYSWGGASVQSAVDVVNAVKDHPAIIMWTVGNEWNYNGLYYGMSFRDARQRVADVVAAIKAADPYHPVSTIYGELPDRRTLNILDQVDVWAINAYRGIGFGNLFSSWRSLSSKPMFFGEYGADAWDANNNNVNLTAQAEATTVLTNLIIQNSVANGGVCSGGFLFEFADEWWKDYEGSPWVHDVGGVAPGGGPYPDRTFNEEWWGIVDVDRNLRPAFEAYRATPIPR